MAGEPAKSFEASVRCAEWSDQMTDPNVATKPRKWGTNIDLLFPQRDDDKPSKGGFRDFVDIVFEMHKELSNMMTATA